jgi:hypothetical protein
MGVRWSRMSWTEKGERAPSCSSLPSWPRSRSPPDANDSRRSSSWRMPVFRASVTTGSSDRERLAAPAASSFVSPDDSATPVSSSRPRGSRTSSFFSCAQGLCRFKMPRRMLDFRHERGPILWCASVAPEILASRRGAHSPHPRRPHGPHLARRRSMRWRRHCVCAGPVGSPGSGQNRYAEAWPSRSRPRQRFDVSFRLRPRQPTIPP